MGIGYAVIAPKETTDKIVSVSEKHKIKAFELGTVKKGEKTVLLKPKGIAF